MTLGQYGAIADGSDRAAFLDGSSGYAKIPSSTSLSPSSTISLEAWVKPAAGQFGLQKPILVKGFTSHNPPYYQYGLFMQDSSSPNGPKKVSFWLALGGSSVTLNVLSSGWQYGIWNHFVGTYDGSTMRLYLNGNLIGSQAATGSISSYATPLDIGAYENLTKNSSFLFGGGVDEVAVYNSALSSTAVQQHYDAATVGTCSNISGATSSTYQLGGSDVGKSVRAVVTATNASGSTSATSDPIGPAINQVVPAKMVFGGSNAAAPGACKCDQNAADPVDTARGGFPESTTDFNVATFGPPLQFSRTYDSQLAQQQAASGSPGLLGYGWTDNWNSSLATGLPTPSDIYRVAGSSSGTSGTSGGGGAATSALLHTPSGLALDGDGNVYLADTANNRIEEIAAKTHTQWGLSMTAGSIYTIAGSSSGTAGSSGNGGAATSALLRGPTAVALDSSGNLYIADASNNRVQEVAASTSTQWGILMTANNIYTVAGSAAGTSGTTGDGGAATSALFNTPSGVALDSAGDLLIADTASNRIRAVAKTTGTHWGVTMTANNAYTIAGSTSVTPGYTGDLGPATSARLNTPSGIAIDGTNNLYIADTGNNRVQEVAGSAHTQYGISMTANSIYTIAGDVQGTAGAGGNGGPATSALLQGPKAVAVDGNGSVYVTDSGNNRVQEIAFRSAEHWGQGMTAAGIYTVAGSAAGTSGLSGDGGVATSALLHTPAGIGTDALGNVVVSDQANNTLRLLASATAKTLPLSPNAGAVSVALGTGSEVLFVPPSGGACVAPNVGTGASGTYCNSPDVTASLTYDSASSTYTFITHPYAKYTFNSSGRLTSESLAGGAALTLSYGSPSPGSGACPSAANDCDTVTSASSRALVIAHNSAGRVTSVIDPLGRSWTYAYCASPSSTCNSGDLVSATDPLGNVTSYDYDATNSNTTYRHDLTTITKPNGQLGGSHAGTHLTNHYDAQGRVDSQTEPAGDQTTFDYTNFDLTTGDGYVIATDPDGNQTKYEYSGAVLKAKVDGYGTGSAATWTHTSDPASLLDVGITDGLGNSTSATYDAAGNTASTTDALGKTSTETYNAFDEPTCEASALAASSCAALTPPGPLTAGASTITPPSGTPPAYVTYHEYDTDGNLIWTTVGIYNPGSSTATTQRTEYHLYNGQSVTIGSNTTSCAASAPSTSLPCASIDANGVVTQLAYNSAGDLTARATSDGNPGGEIATTTYAYNADGERTSETKPDGNLTGAIAANFTTSTTYNSAGDITAITVGHTGGGSVARTTSYGYDPNRNRTSVTDARNKTTSYTFDADDRRVLQTDPVGNATLTCYDGDGNVAQSVPPVGVAANSLTPASCPTSYPSGYGTRLANDATTYAYDYSGQKTEETTPAPVGQTGHETTSYVYDVAGRLTSITAPPASNSFGAPNQVTTYSYDADGQLQTETVGAGTSSASTTSYCYDPLGQKTAVVAPNGNASGVATCSSASPWTTGSAYETTYSYDSVGELHAVTRPATSAGPSGQSTSYTYDPAGNQATSTDANGTTTTKTYSPLNQLTNVSYSGSSAHSVAYTYDASGNRLSMTDATGTSSYAYDEFNELTTYQNGAGNSVAYTYDADGHVASIAYPLGAGATWATSNSVSYGYDDAGSLTSIGDFAGNSITIGNTADRLRNSVTLGASGDTITTTYDATDMPRPN
jgi:YD repeat-containing protein